MTVTYSKFQSSKGFEAGNISISDTGDIQAQSIDIDIIKLGGEVLFTAGSGSLTLPANVTGSELTSLGTLVSLTVQGNVTVTNGLIQITSSTTGSIDNINIGQTTSGTASFTDLTATGNISITSNTIGSLDNVAIGQTVPAQAEFTEVTSSEITSNNITINQLPTNVNHAVRKDYFDSRLSAFTIAFGS
jgi:hypothetical protein